MENKKKKGVMISFDFRASLPPPSFEGLKAAKLVIPSTGLSRDKKAELELRIAAQFLNSFASSNQLAISNVRTHDNPQESPDVVFDLDGSTIGIEVSELLPVNRLGKDDALKRLKESILSKLQLSSTTKNWVIVISLASDYSPKIKAPSLDNEIAQMLINFFSSNNIKFDQYNVLKLPKDRGTITLYKADLSEEPQIREENEPLIAFLGYNTAIFPSNDIPKIIEERLREKFSIATSIPLWLLLWSEHSSLASLNDEIVLAIVQYCTKHVHHYERIIYQSLQSGKYTVLIFK